ncbi:hypothetical protein 2011_scaffold152_00017 [Bacteriophage sp.]|nr:hypothetical protein 2011_scaffold152_00017 [Bacteriophage sp.]
MFTAFERVSTVKEIVLFCPAAVVPSVAASWPSVAAFSASVVSFSTSTVSTVWTVG